MDYKISRTYNATIYCGFMFRKKSGYMTYLNSTIEEHYLEAKKICHDYCNEVGLCVNIKQKTFIYTKSDRNDGEEEGVEVGLINYPRFESTPIEIQDHAIEIGGRLMKHFKQYRVSIVCDNFTYMLSNEELEQDA